MRSLIAPLVPAIMRHLQAYADVAGEDARDAAALIARRLAALLVAAAAALVALLMLCVWFLALAWDTPWRTWTAAGLAVAFAVVAAVLAIPALRPGARDRKMFFHRIRAEVNRDRELIERAFDGPERTTHKDEHASG